LDWVFEHLFKILPNTVFWYFVAILCKNHDSCKTIFACHACPWTSNILPKEWSPKRGFSSFDPRFCWSVHVCCNFCMVIRLCTIFAIFFYLIAFSWFSCLCLDFFFFLIASFWANLMNNRFIYFHFSQAFIFITSSWFSF
jgi:hypothetical protein